MHTPAKSLVKPDKYQVFLMVSRAGLPISFGLHPWFVVNKKGTLSRFEVLWQPEDAEVGTQWGHLAENALPPFQGLRVLHFLPHLSWKGKVLKVLEGDEQSLAARMGAFIENTPQTYPYKDAYSFSGLNSNTYAQWVLNQFPESGMKLPWNAFGKNR